MSASAAPAGRGWLVPVLRGFSGLTSGRIVASVLSALFLAVVARHLSTGDFGELVLLLAFGTVAGVVCDRGLQIVVGLHAAQAGAIDLRLLDSAIARRLLLAVPTCLVVAVLYLSAVRDGSLAEPAIFAVSILGTCVYQLALASYMALGKVSLNACNEMFSRAFVLVGGVLWLLHGGGLFGVVAAYSLADLLSAIVIYAIIRRSFALPETAVPLPPVSIRATMPLALAATVLIVYSRIDTYLVTIIKGTSAAAYYGSAYRVLSIVTLPALALSQIAIAHTVPRGTERRRSDALRLAALAAAPTVPALVLGLAFSTQVMRLVFGADYAVAGPTLIVLLASAIPGAVVLVLAPLAAVGNRVRYAWVTVAGLVVNVGINLVLIPIAGPLGAAWANLISQLMIAAALLTRWMLLPGTGPDPTRSATEAIPIGVDPGLAAEIEAGIELGGPAAAPGEGAPA